MIFTSGNGVAVLQQRLLQFVHMPGPDFTRICLILLTQPGGSRHSLPHAGAGQHHAGGAHTDVGGTDTSSHHHQIRYVFGIQTPEGHGSHGDFLITGKCALSSREDTFDMMHVNIPPAEKYGVGIVRPGSVIILGNHIVPHKPSGLPFCIECPQGLQLQFSHFFSFRPGIFQPVKEARRHTNQRISCVLLFPQIVIIITVFQPPLAHDNSAGPSVHLLSLRQRNSPVRRCKFHILLRKFRSIAADSIMEIRMIPDVASTHGIPVGILRREILLILPARFSSDMIGRPGIIPQPSISGIIHKLIGAESMLCEAQCVNGVY